MGRKRSRKKGDWITVSIRVKTKEEIKRVGKYGDNFDDVLRRVLEMVRG